MDGDGHGGAVPGAAANIIAMQPADLQRLAQLMRGGSTKLRRMTEATPEAWLEYRRHFQKVALLQGWDDERSRQEISAGMQEKAGNAVADILINAPGRNIDQLIQLYSERFMPAAAGATARKNYQSARQLPTESVREWHTRARELFFLAYPGEDPNAQNHCLDLFVNGLHNNTVKFFVASQPINQFHEALPIAERAETANRDNVGAAGRQQIGALPGPSGGAGGARGPLACYFCQDVFKISSPHLKNRCPYFLAANRLFQADGGSPQGAATPAVLPPSNTKRRNNRRGKKKGVNAIQAAAAPPAPTGEEADVSSDDSGN